MRYILGLSIGMIVFLMLPSCTFDNEQDYDSDTICDTTNVTYSDLTYIFTNICSECHFPDNPYKAGIVMNTYDNVKKSFNTGQPWGAINHLQGYVPMPYSAPKLSDCDINKIKAWIDQGMPEKK